MENRRRGKAGPSRLEGAKAQTVRFVQGIDMNDDVKCRVRLVGCYIYWFSL